MTHQIGAAVSPGYVDKRRSHKDDFETRIVSGAVVFTANAVGTTTTIVGANAAPATGTNVARLGDEFKLFNSSNVLKEEKVFRVTTIAVAASTTVTFTPAAAANTASGDYYKLVGLSNQSSTGEMDRRLAELGISATNIAKMTENDKLYQIRTSDDPGSL
jgi:hypothetical protein